MRGPGSGEGMPALGGRKGGPRGAPFLLGTVPEGVSVTGPYLILSRSDAPETMHEKTLIELLWRGPDEGFTKASRLQSPRCGFNL